MPKHPTLDLWDRAVRARKAWLALPNQHHPSKEHQLMIGLYYGLTAVGLASPLTVAGGGKL